MAPDYTSLMDDLRAGKLEVLEIDPEHFNDFRQAWTNYPARKEIVGDAQRGGKINYHFRSSNAD
ncbi:MULTISPECIES: hypothetical protein [Lacticaseibacillus]|uniref:Uncharacterized protein n=2 Tax=Lacticaseibacillus TaxID=2759736 RepID=A0ABW4CHF6_9LACO|nr:MULTISPECIES: hypothetical protein [Lacticaseibacillus]